MNSVCRSAIVVGMAWACTSMLSIVGAQDGAKSASPPTQPAAVAVGQVQQARVRILEDLAGMAIPAPVRRARTRREEVPDEHRRERIGDVHRPQALVVPGDVDEARRALIEHRQVRRRARAAAGAVGVADEHALLRVETIRDVIEAEGRQ